MEKLKVTNDAAAAVAPPEANKASAQGNTQSGGPDQGQAPPPGRSDATLIVFDTQDLREQLPLVKMGELELILRHRAFAKQIREEKAGKSKETLDDTKNKKLSGKVMKTKQYDKFISRLDTITLDEMDPRKKLSYPGKILFLYVVEEAVCVLLSSGDTMASVIVKDPIGNYTRLLFYKNPEEDDKYVLGFGARIGIINPELWCWPDVDFGIFVKAPEVSLYHSGTPLRRCRNCGYEEANNWCSNCKKAWYCSRKCQKIDWKVYGHKMICVP